MERGIAHGWELPLGLRFLVHAPKFLHVHRRSQEVADGPCILAVNGVEHRLDEAVENFLSDERLVSHFSTEDVHEQFVVAVDFLLDSDGSTDAGGELRANIEVGEREDLVVRPRDGDMDDVVEVPELLEVGALVLVGHRPALLVEDEDGAVERLVGAEGVVNHRGGLPATRRGCAHHVVGELFGAQADRDVRPVVDGSLGVPDTHPVVILREEVLVSRSEWRASVG